MKEVCDLHAEAFSGAEFLHGPVALVEPDYPVLIFMATDEAGPGLRRLAADIATRARPCSPPNRARCIPAGCRHCGRPGRCRCNLPDTRASRLAVHLAARRGTDADRRATCRRSPAQDDRGRARRGRQHNGPLRPPMAGAEWSGSMAPGRHAVAADRFDGRLRRDAAVLIEGTDIAAVVPRRELPAGLAVRQNAGRRVAGARLHRHPGQWRRRRAVQRRADSEGIAAIAAAHRRFGTTALLPTLITDTADKMAPPMRAVAARWPPRMPGVLGIHLEGPFLSPERPGCTIRR